MTDHTLLARLRRIEAVCSSVSADLDAALAPPPAAPSVPLPAVALLATAMVSLLGRLA